MRAIVFVSVAVYVSGCSLLYPTSDHQRSSAADASLDAAPDGAACANPDVDNDTHDAIACGGDDCNDGNSAVYPGAPQLCGNGQDEICGDPATPQQFGVAGRVQRFPARGLFGYDAPTLSGVTTHIPRLSAASTSSMSGAFVVAGVESVSGEGEVFIWSASLATPASYSAIAEYTALRPSGGNVAGIVVGRNQQGGEADVDVMWVFRSPAASLMSGHVGTINVYGSGPAFDSNVTISAMNAAPVWRPGAVMTDEPPRWVVGEVNAFAGTDQLSSCIKADAGSCVTVNSTIASEPSTYPSELAGSTSGHVFFRTGDGALGLWNTTNAPTSATTLDTFTSAGSSMRGRPSVARVGAAIGNPAMHHHLVAVPYTDAVPDDRVVLIRADCLRAATPGACTLSAGVELPKTSGESFAGPVAISDYGADRFIVVTAVRSGAMESLRAFVGTYNTSTGAIAIGHSEDVETYPASSGALTDVTVTFLVHGNDPSALSIVWQRGSGPVQVRSAGYAFCEAP